MCRYAYKEYKPHFVCFRCRAQFKRPTFHDVAAQRGTLDLVRRLERAHGDDRARPRLEKAAGTTLKILWAEHHHLVRTCPQCSRPMAHLGLDFKPPRKQAKRAWARIESIHLLGYHWQTCGCDGPGYIPTDGTGFRQYLRARLASFRAQIRMR